MKSTEYAAAGYPAAVVYRGIVSGNRDKDYKCFRDLMKRLEVWNTRSYDYIESHHLCPNENIKNCKKRHNKKENDD